MAQTLPTIQVGNNDHLHYTFLPNAVTEFEAMFLLLHSCAYLQPFPFITTQPFFLPICTCYYSKFTTFHRFVCSYTYLDALHQLLSTSACKYDL